MIINVLIATIDSGLEQVENILLEPRPDLLYIVSHQVTGGEYRDKPPALDRSDVVLIQMAGRGLSRNRNHALSAADGDIVLLADDDAHYRQEYFDTVKKAFCDDESMDVACFKIATTGGEPAYKDYAKEPYLLNDRSHHFISSLEIAFRLDTIKKKGIVFDERFGLGSPLVPSGEEAVFIHDCIKAGLKVKYVPEYVVEHPEKSTTKTMSSYATARNIFKGAYDARRYGLLAYPAAFYDALRYRQNLRRENIKPQQYVRERLKGARYILGGSGRGKLKDL